MLTACAAKIAKGLKHPAFEQRCPRQRCAHVERFKQAEFVESAIDYVRDAKTKILPIKRLERRPHPLEGRSSGDDGAVAILGTAPRYAR